MEAIRSQPSPSRDLALLGIKSSTSVSGPEFSEDHVAGCYISITATKFVLFQYISIHPHGGVNFGLPPRNLIIRLYPSRTN